MAVGHKVLRVMYTVLTEQKPYTDPEVDYTQLIVKKNAPRWIKMLTEYGYLQPAQ